MEYQGSASTATESNRHASEKGVFGGPIAGKWAIPGWTSALKGHFYFYLLSVDRLLSRTVSGKICDFPPSTDVDCHSLNELHKIKY